MNQEEKTNQWLNEFKNSAGLRAEFDGDVDAYVAFKKAEAEGRAKVLSGVVVTADA